MYAHFRKLDYFSTECIYAPNAYRGYARTYLKDLESIRPSVIMDIIFSGETMQFEDTPSSNPARGSCERCGFVASNKLCKACVLLEGLNKGRPKLAVGKSRDQRQLAQMPEMEETNGCLSGSNGKKVNGMSESCCGRGGGKGTCLSKTKDNIEVPAKAKTANNEIDF